MKKQYGTFAMLFIALQSPLLHAMGIPKGNEGDDTSDGDKGDPVVTGNVVSDISNIASNSTCRSSFWGNGTDGDSSRGRAPAGYISGMALSFAKSLCRLQKGENAAAVMAQKNRNNSTYDAVTVYENRFDNMKFEIDVSGPDTLRSLYTLGIGLGMRESSGRYCEGRDRSAENTSSETAEAGMFQTSYNARAGNAEQTRLFEKYKTGSEKCFLDVFKSGVSCSSSELSDSSNYGSGEGRKFQQLSKTCPAFAAEYAMITLRTLRKHYGPIVRGEAQLSDTCNKMLDQVQDYVNSKASSVCNAL